MSDVSAEIDPYLQQALDLVRDLNERAMEQKDPSLALELYAATGSIALGVKNYQEALNRGSIEIPVITSEIAPITLSETELALTKPEIVEAAEISHQEQIEAPAPIVETMVVEPIKAQEILAPDEYDEIKSQYSELKLTTREARMIDLIAKTNGRVFKTSEILDQMPELPSRDAGTVSFSKLVRRIHNSPYAHLLNSPGTQGGRRHVWVGESHGLDEKLAEPTVDINNEPELQLKEFIPDETIIISEEVADIEIESLQPSFTDVLATVGIDFSQNGHKELSVKGVPLKLSPFATEVLVTVAKHGGDTVYKKLLDDESFGQFDETYAEPKGKTTLARHLTTALNEIETALKDFDISWFNQSIPKDGKSVRIIRFNPPAPVPSAPPDTSDFLA